MCADNEDAGMGGKNLREHGIVILEHSLIFCFLFILHSVQNPLIHNLIFDHDDRYSFCYVSIYCKIMFKLFHT